ncbi:helix-turn-helix domain-containing protein [Streptosporangium lutulentum]
MKRQVSYQWRLREVMAAHGMFTISDLVPLLVERGINLSVSQVHRLATGVPERLSLPVLAALCDIFTCTPAELIATKAENMAIRKTARRRRPRQPQRAAAQTRPSSSRSMNRPPLICEDCGRKAADIGADSAATARWPPTFELPSTTEPAASGLS